MLTTTAALLVLTLSTAADVVLIRDVPHVKQKPDFCGEACAEMYLRKLGHAIDQDDVFEASGLDPLEGRGCHTKELSVALERIGFKIGSVWRTIRKARAAEDLRGEWEAMLLDLKQGVPSIVCMRTAKGPEANEHFRLVLGYDVEQDRVVYHEPAEERGEYRTMPRSELLDLWPLKSDPEKWLAVRLRLEAGDIHAKHSSSAITSADYAQHVLELKKRLPGSGFTLVLSSPFVVCGDEDAETVRRRARSTVAWSVERLKKQFFEKDPGEIIDIWLFKDKQSYETNALKLFGSRPTTPFGYYSAEHRSLVMNISTGGGTLVHEIVHPFVRANFPSCPAWFNEGLASLYEQSGDRNGRLVGFTNWRLAGLQEALRAQKVPGFKELLATTEDAFYHQDRGTNYAQARYLCYYLQEKSLLEGFYREHSLSVKDDPTGYESLKRTLRKSDKEMPTFEAQWRQFVLGLRFE